MPGLSHAVLLNYPTNKNYIQLKGINRNPLPYYPAVEVIVNKHKVRPAELVLLKVCLIKTHKRKVALLKEGNDIMK